MSYKLHVAAERAHEHALAASRRAIAAGDLVKAERWMKLAERHYRCHEMALTQRERRRRALKRIGGKT